jgi:hypothetical protein
MDKRLFAFLKGRKIFTKGGGGKVTLQEALTNLEVKTEQKDRARKVIKKAKAK